MADLVSEISIPVTCDFLWVSSYGKGTKSRKEIDLVCEHTVKIQGKNLLIVDDIIDTGHTLQFVKDYFASQNPLSIRICTLLDKPDCRKVDVPVDYALFTVPDKFVVGYGLDFSEQYRNLKYLAVLKERQKQPHP